MQEFERQSCRLIPVASLKSELRDRLVGGSRVDGMRALDAAARFGLELLRGHQVTFADSAGGVLRRGYVLSDAIDSLQSIPQDGVRRTGAVSKDVLVAVSDWSPYGLKSHEVRLSQMELVSNVWQLVPDATCREVQSALRSNGAGLCGSTEPVWCWMRGAQFEVSAAASEGGVAVLQPLDDPALTQYLLNRLSWAGFDIGFACDEFFIRAGSGSRMSCVSGRNLPNLAWECFVEVFGDEMLIEQERAIATLSEAQMRVVESALCNDESSTDVQFAAWLNQDMGLNERQVQAVIGLRPVAMSNPMQFDLRGGLVVRSGFSMSA